MARTWLVGLAVAALVGCGDDPGQSVSVARDSGADAPVEVASDSGATDTGEEAWPLEDTSVAADTASDTVEASVDADAAEAEAGPYVPPASDEVLCKKDATGRLLWKDGKCWDQILPSFVTGLPHPAFVCSFQKYPGGCWAVLEGEIRGYDGDACEQVLLRMLSPIGTGVYVVTAIGPKGEPRLMEISMIAGCPANYRSADGLCTSKPTTFPWCVSGQVAIGQVDRERTKLIAKSS